MIIINKSGNWSYPYDFKGRGELADSRELIFKKSKSEPFLLLEHPPSPNPITLPIVYPQGARANLIETAFPNCKKVYFSRLKSARWLISTTYFMYCIRKKKKKKILSLGSVENQKLVSGRLEKRVSSMGQT